MRKIGIIFAVAFSLAGAGVCLTSTASVDVKKNGVGSNDLKPVCENFIGQLSRGDKDAFNLLWKNMAAPEEARSAIDAQRQAAELRYAEEKLGKYLGCELVQEKTSGTSLRKYIYLGKYEKHAIQWTVILYRPNDEWKILSFVWTRLDDSPF